MNENNRERPLWVFILIIFLLAYVTCVFFIEPAVAQPPEDTAMLKRILAEQASNPNGCQPIFWEGPGSCNCFVGCLAACDNNGINQYQTHIGVHEPYHTHLDGYVSDTAPVRKARPKKQPTIKYQVEELTGIYNFCIGPYAGMDLTTGSYNIIVKDSGLMNATDTSFAFLVDYNNSILQRYPEVKSYLHWIDETFRKWPYLRKNKSFQIVIHRHLNRLAQLPPVDITKASTDASWFYWRDCAHLGDTEKYWKGYSRDTTFSDYDPLYLDGNSDTDTSGHSNVGYLKNDLLLPYDTAKSKKYPLLIGTRVLGQLEHRLRRLFHIIF